MDLMIQIQVSCNLSQAPYSLYFLLSLAPFFPTCFLGGLGKEYWDTSRNIQDLGGCSPSLLGEPHGTRSETQISCMPSLCSAL